MKKIFSLIAVISFFLTATLSAGEFADLKKKVAVARDTAMEMLKDKNKRGADQQKKAKDSAEDVSMSIHHMNPPKGKEAKFNELHETWMAMKKTREEEVIPAILAGKDADAEKIINGIQKERTKKINALCDELDK